MQRHVLQRVEETLLRRFEGTVTAETVRSVVREVVADSPAEFEKFQAQELARWKQVIEVGKIVAD